MYAYSKHISIHIYINTFKKNTYIHISTHIYLHICIYVCICKYINIYIYINIQTHSILSYTCIWLHMYILYVFFSVCGYLGPGKGHMILMPLGCQLEQLSQAMLHDTIQLTGQARQSNSLHSVMTWTYFAARKGWHVRHENEADSPPASCGFDPCIPAL